jgi:hypothetical protein
MTEQDQIEQYNEERMDYANFQEQQAEHEAAQALSDPHGSRCVDPENCKVSTGICDRLTFGAGKLDEYGYWEIPCDHCARKHERDNPNDGECWPWASIDNDQMNHAMKGAKNERE